ncbi:MAG TPA: type II toxin-antitoxin system VapB family antitoxin [Planctomycetota bacterium]|nr:type II toxin-antitoxin system VapB family antitoxin [Planctomycetota bacterium]
MLTNIDLDEELVEKARELTGLRTKKAVVEAGLRALIKLNEQSDVRKLWGRLPWQEPQTAGTQVETPEEAPQKGGKRRGGHR